MCPDRPVRSSGCILQCYSCKKKKDICQYSQKKSFHSRYSGKRQKNVLLGMTVLIAF